MIRRTEILRDHQGLFRQDLCRNLRQVNGVNRLFQGQATGFVFQLFHAPLALFSELAGPGLDLRLTGVVVLPQRIQGSQAVAHIAPDRQIEGKRIAQEIGIVTAPQCRARVLKPQILRNAARILAVAHTQDNVVRLFRQIFHLTNIVGMLRRETAVVKKSGGHRQGHALGQFENVVLRFGRQNVRSADQQRLVGVEQGIKNRVDHTVIGHHAHVRRVRRLNVSFDIRLFQ